MEINLDREAEPSQHIRILLERSRLLDKLFVGAGSQLAATFPVLVDMRHLIVAEIKAHPQEFRA